MAIMQYISSEASEQFKRSMPKSKVMEEYEKYLRDLPKGKVGQLAVTRSEKPQTIKNRVVRAARSLNMTDLKVKRVGDNILVWREA